MKTYSKDILEGKRLTCDYKWYKKITLSNYKN